MNWPTLARLQRYEKSKETGSGGDIELEVGGLCWMSMPTND